MPASQLYRHGMYWTATGSGTIGGTPYVDGNIIYVEGDPDAAYLLESEVTFHVYDSTADGFGVGTGFYMDGSGRFSLGDKLTYDGAGNLTLEGELAAATGSFIGDVSAESFTMLSGSDEVAELYSSDTSYERLRLTNPAGNYWDIGWLTASGGGLGNNRLFLKPNLGANPSTATITAADGIDMVQDGSLSYTSLRGGDALITATSTLGGLALMEVDGGGHVIVSAGGVEIDGPLSLANGNIDAVSTIDVNEIYADLGSEGDPSYTFTGQTTTGMYASSSALQFTVNGARKMFLDADEMFLDGIAIHAGNGSAAAPSYAFNGDSNSGMYSGGNGILRFSLNGSDCLGFDSSRSLFAAGVWSTTTGAGTAVHVVNSNGLVARSTSARKYKKNIRPLRLDEAKQVLDFEAVAYQSKCEADGDEWHVGQIADQVDEVDDRYVTRDEDGEVEGLRYDREVAALCMLVDDLYSRIELLEAQVAGTVNLDG